MKHEEALWSHQGIVRSTKPHLLYSLVYRSWCYLEKTYTTSSFPTCFFFSPLQVERLMLLQAYRNIFSLLHKHLCWWFQCNVLFFFFYKKHLGDSSQPLNDYLSLKMLFVSLWYFSTYLLSVFGLRSCILPIVSIFFFFSPPLPFGHVMFLSLASGKSSQSGLVFPIGGRVCVHRHLVCASLQCFFVHHLTHNSHIHRFCIDLTPKF